MACPHLKEVVMLYCDGAPIKKMLPLDRVVSADPCLGQFTACPIFLELKARLAATAVTATSEPTVALAQKEKHS